MSNNEMNNEKDKISPEYIYFLPHAQKYEKKNYTRFFKMKNQKCRKKLITHSANQKNFLLKWLNE